MVAQAELTEQSSNEIPKVVYEPRQYDTVYGKKLRAFMEDFEREGVARIKTWPVWISQIPGRHCIYQTLGVSPRELAFILREVTEYKVIKPVRERFLKNGVDEMRPAYSLDEVRVLGVYVWAKQIKAKDQPVNTTSRFDAVTIAWSSLGSDPLSTKINYPFLG